MTYSISRIILIALISTPFPSGLTFNSKADAIPLEDSKEIKATEYFSKTVFKRPACSDSLTVKNIKLLQECYGENHPGLLAFLKVADDNTFNYFSLAQIKWMIESYGTLPYAVDRKSNLSQIIKEEDGFYTFKFNNGPSDETLVNDCFRNNYSLASLYQNPLPKSLTSPSIELKNLPIESYFNGSLKSVIYNFGNLGFVAVNQKAIIGIPSNLKVGDVIYTNPLVYGYQSWDAYKLHEQIKLQYTYLTILKNIFDQSYVNTNEIPKIERDSYFKSLQTIESNELPINMAKVVREEAINYMLQVFTKNYTAKELSIISKALDDQVQSNISRTSNLEQLNPRMIELEGKMYKTSPAYAQFHIMTVVSVTNRGVFVHNIDGSRPMESSKFININEVVLPKDLVLVMRK